MQRPLIAGIRRLLAFNTAALAVSMAAIVVVWAIDTRADDNVRRNTELAGRPIGSLNLEQLRAAVQSIAADYGGTSITIVAKDADGDSIATTSDAASLGVTVDVEATMLAALEVGRQRALPMRPLTWLGSVIGDDTGVPLLVTVDSVTAETAISAADRSGRVAATEPSVTEKDGAVEPVSGEDGFGIDIDHAIAAIPQAARSGGPIRVRGRTSPIPPRFDLDDARAVARRANELTANPLTITADGASATVEPATMAAWATAVVGESDGEPALLLAFDQTRLEADLAELLAEIETEPVNASFVVENFGSETDERVAVRPGRPGRECCAADAGQLVLNALEAGVGPDPAVAIPFRDLPPEITLDNADALGVVERIGSFTTRHEAGQSRVKNIHRIADLTRGVLIEPGGTFSVNGFVGRRTRAKGFVAAGVIYNGVFTEDVGGGISQYATTLFNAAFFGGLEIPTYQSHSIYISRYPYGREATLSFPQPDLKIMNNTPHGVLIWPTYTSSSITVTLFSTKWVRGEQVGQTSRRQGRCTRVTTTRERTYLTDGRTKRDTVFALYRPEEGVNC